MTVISYRQALHDTLRAELQRDENVFLIGEEVAEYDGAYKVSQGMLAKYGPMRVVDAPISEAGFAGLGIGAAMVGMRPKGAGSACSTSCRSTVRRVAVLLSVRSLQARRRIAI